MPGAVEWSVEGRTGGGALACSPQRPPFLYVLLILGGVSGSALLSFSPPRSPPHALEEPRNTATGALQSFEARPSVSAD